MARLALVADELNDEVSAKILRENIKKVIGPWLNSTNSDNLLYDSTWGGICSKNGLQSPDNDFGQGWVEFLHNFQLIALVQ